MMNIPPSKPFAEAYTPGVYFLYNGETLVYIGQSRAIELRLEQHRSLGRVFDRFAFIRIEDLAERLVAESTYIHEMLEAPGVRLKNRIKPRGSRNRSATVTALLPQQLARDLRECADRLGISVSALVEEAVRHFLPILRQRAAEREAFWPRKQTEAGASVN